MLPVISMRVQFIVVEERVAVAPMVEDVMYAACESLNGTMCTYTGFMADGFSHSIIFYLFIFIVALSADSSTWSGEFRGMIWPSLKKPTLDT